MSSETPHVACHNPPLLLWHAVCPSRIFMNFRKLALCIALAAVLFRTAAAAPAPAPDPLNRTNPRAAITGFLVACHQDDFSKAAEYLDLSRLPARQREQEGPIHTNNPTPLPPHSGSYSSISMGHTPHHVYYSLHCCSECLPPLPLHLHPLHASQLIQHCLDSLVWLGGGA